MNKGAAPMSGHPGHAGLLLLFLQTCQSALGLSSMGTVFMMAPPTLIYTSPFEPIHYVKFLLSTYIENEFQVIATVPHCEAAKPIRLGLRRGNVLEYMPRKDLLQDIQVGHRWTFRFHGDELFGLTVIMLNSLGGSATFLALPVDAWGVAYMVVTGKLLPFIIVTSSKDGNKVEIEFPQYPGNAVFKHNDVTYKQGSKMSIDLKQWESFSISDCNYVQRQADDIAPLDGTTVKATFEVGVISGSCLTNTLDAKCVGDYQPKKDMIAEMLFPVSDVRQEYVFPNVPRLQTEPLLAELIVVASEASTLVDIQRATGHVMISSKVAEVIRRQSHAGSHYLYTSEHVLIMYAEASVCPMKHIEPFDPGPNLCMILPVHLYHYTYIWRTPGLGVANFVLMVVRKNYTDFLELDGLCLQDVIWEDVVGETGYTIGNHMVSEGDHRLESSEMNTFGCYLYGLGQRSSYMHLAGYQSCGGPYMEARNDRIDNDCDGQVDEEYKNEKDDDEDGKIDEDLTEDNMIQEMQTKIIVSSLGTTFLLSCPNLHSAFEFVEPLLNFYLSTFSLKSFEVTVEAIAFSLSSVIQRVTLKKGRTQVVGPATNDLPNAEKGTTLTYRLTGADKFTVTVVMRTAADGTATYNALPVYAWGTIYYVITGKSMPFVLITTVEENTVTMWLSGSKGIPVEFKFEGVLYKAYDKLERKLKMLETFVISKCSGNEAFDNVHAILDGAKVIAEKPVGVISGNCRTIVNGIKCPELLKRTDMMAEMMLPVDEYRRRVILPNIPNRLIPAEMVVVSPWPNTKFFVSSASEIERYVTNSGDVVKNPYHTGNFYIRSDKGILTMYTQTSTCRTNYEEPMGAAPNLCIVIPTSLFYYRYFWRTPDLQTMDFILIVARKKDRIYLIWDDKPLNLTLGWEEVYGAPMYTVGNKKVVKGHHVLVSTRMYTFACYVYGFGRNNSYMHSAGFQECGLGPDSDTKDDLIDNDCDGQIDEEMKDNIDNDGDGFIDEDLNSKYVPSQKYYLLLFLGMIVVYIVLFIIVKKSGIIKRKKKANTPPVGEEAKEEDAKLSESEMLQEADAIAGSEVDSGSASGRGSDHRGNTAQSYVSKFAQSHVSRMAPSHVSRKAESTVASYMYSVAPNFYGTNV